MSSRRKYSKYIGRIADKAERKIVYANPEEKLQIALKNESCQYYQAKQDLDKCLDKHKDEYTNNNAHFLDVPSACHDAKFLCFMLEQEKLYQQTNILTS